MCGTQGPNYRTLPKFILARNCTTRQTLFGYRPAKDHGPETTKKTIKKKSHSIDLRINHVYY